MPVTRDQPYISVRLYDAGHGDPIVIEPGTAWYDVMEQAAGTGTPSVDANGFPLTEFIPGVGLCCRAFLVQKSLTTAQGSTSSGTWEDRALATGRYIGRISQLDTAASLTSWSYRWGYPHPANPQVAFSLLLFDTPSDWDYATYPPFVRIELGNAYGLQFTKDGAFLMRFVAGAWRAVMSLPNPPRSGGYQDAEETWIWVRVLRGTLLISFDGGNSYASYTEPGGVTISAGQIVLRGRGGAVTFGIHQLISYAATWDSAVRYVDRSRAAATATFTGSRYEAPTGTASNSSVGFTDLGVPLARQQQYRATLTPAVTTGTLWDWYHSPVLYAAMYRTAPLLQTIGNNSTTPYDTLLTSFRINKPRDLAGGSATFTVELDAYEENELRGLLLRKVEIDLGYRLSDGNDDFVTAFTGYITEISASWGEELSKAVVTFQCANASLRLRRNPWGPFLQSVLSGQTPNAAGAEILEWHGLNSSYYSWSAYGASGVIDPGSPEEPCELCNITELPWETLTRIMDERYLEVGVDDTGVFFTLPKNYASAIVDVELRAVPEDPTDPEATDQREMPKSLSMRMDALEGATAVICYARDANGQFVFASAVDVSAETDITSNRFRPWKETVLREIPGTVTAGYLAGHAANLAQLKFRLNEEADYSVPIDFRRSRRDRVALYGFQGVDAPDGTECVILTMEHSGQRQQGLLEMETKAGLQRLT
jgi:hypothetical protein